MTSKSTPDPTPPSAPSDLIDREVGRPDQTVVLPLAREEVHVEKKIVETGRVAVHVVPTTRTEHVDVALADERAIVERVPINEFVSAPQPTRREGDVTIIPIYEEVVVVERRLRLKEEVRIRVERSTRQETRDVELRSEEAEVVRSPDDPTKRNPG